ncbi:D-aspartate oxidase [Merluccius polli]|uniref:D-aspartate oxidase n=1 Tax=Merluccius polli TaxID=89951 RepID=A0AA47M349_MERPO|nr:D-aspartate oxidase [Merluccius polli]
MKRVELVVVGAGVIGLSTAVVLAEALPLCRVTVVADQFSPDTTSDGAAGILLIAQFPDIPVERQTRWFKDSFDHLLAIAQSDQAPDAGVMLTSGCQIFREVPAQKVPFWSELVLGFPSPHRARAEKGFRSTASARPSTTLKCECEWYPALAGEEVQESWGWAGSCDIIVNCSGLRAKALAGDEQVYPVRGQVLKVRAPWISHFIRDGDGKDLHLTPPRGAQCHGGGPEARGRPHGLGEHPPALWPAGAHARPRARCWPSGWVLRPGREEPQGGSERRWRWRAGGHRVPLVHNYGHGGAGVALSWGTALDTLGLVKQCPPMRCLCRPGCKTWRAPRPSPPWKTVPACYYHLVGVGGLAREKQSLDWDGTTLTSLSSS